MSGDSSDGRSQSSSPTYLPRRRSDFVAIALTVLIGVLAVVVWSASTGDSGELGNPGETGTLEGDLAADAGAAGNEQRIGGAAPAEVASPPPRPLTPTPVPVATALPYVGWFDPARTGDPYPGTVQGLLTFRGNPSRTWYGTGPMPHNPVERWRFDGTGGPGGVDDLCSMTTVGQTTSEWCGTGWTGQPAVFERDGKQWVVFGSYAPAVHFLNAETGDRLLPDFPVGDLIKGSVTIDPDGYPLVYVGSRDDFFRVIAFDGDAPRELWSLAADAVQPTLWNNDWDATALMLDDHLFIGGENSQWHVVELQRGYDADGRVTVDPALIFNGPGWDDQLLEDLGDDNVSIETSMTISGDLLWFANSGGLVQAWDIEPLRTGRGEPERVLRFWTGDDTDASVVVDEDGFAYVGSELERLTDRSLELGQIMKLDPRRPDDPLVWTQDIHVVGAVPDGVWATPALHRDVLYVPTNEGLLFALDRETGAIRWRKKLQGPIWSSPVVVDDVLVQADCAGVIRGFDVSDTTVEPPELWSVELPWCVESTPAVWEGVLYVGHRRGEVWSIGDP